MSAPYQAWCERHLQKLQARRGGWAKALCPLPGHEDHFPSFSVNLESGGWRCHACDRTGHLRPLARELGLPTDGMPDDRPKSTSAPSAAGSNKLTQECEYIYTDPSGTPVLRVVRYRDANGDKAFRQFHRGENGEWVKGQGGVKVPPYHLHLLHQADPATPIVWVEGEKDAEWGSTLGLLTTTSAMGAGNLSRTHRPYLEVFRGRTVWIIPDNDEPGRKYAQDIARTIQDIAAEIRIIPLPGVPTKGDLADWVHLGGDAAALARLAAQTPPWEPEQPLPLVLVGDRDLKDITTEALAALERHNQPPHLFVHGGVVKRLRVVDGRPRLDQLSVESAVNELAEAASWVKPRTVKKVETLVPCYPDRAVASAILHLPQWPFPDLEGVVEAPVFSAERLIQQPGYHPDTRLYLRPSVEVPHVPQHPTPVQIQDAKRWLLDELLGGYLWANQASAAHAVAAILLPFVRPVIGDHPTPLHLIEATSQGSGKSLLARVIGIICLGRAPTTLTEGRDDEEWRKRLTSVLLDGPAMVVLDDIRHSLESANLVAAITSTTWTDRILGQTGNVHLPNRAAWLVTVNNPRLTTDAARRSISIRIDPQTSEPWTRSDFRHHDLADWAVANRSRLVWSCLTLCQAWFAAGKPPGRGPRIGSFERWSSVLGGILQVAGIPGFLENSQELRERTDTEAAEWRAFVEAWRDRWVGANVNTSDLFSILEANPELLLTTVRGNSERGRLTSLGMALARQVDRVFGDWTIRSSPVRDRKGHKCYRLEPVENRRTFPTFDSEGSAEKNGLITGISQPSQPSQPSIPHTRKITITDDDQKNHDHGGVGKRLGLGRVGKSPEVLPDGATLW